MSASDQIFNFVTGLSSVAVANKVREKEPKSLHEAMDIAVRAEVFLGAGRASGTGHIRTRATAARSVAARHVDRADGRERAGPRRCVETPDADEAAASRRSSRRQAQTRRPALLAKMEAMVQHRVAALLQARSDPARQGSCGDRVPD